MPLDIDSVHKVFPGGVHALRGASFRIAQGERACLLGPNGAGKTTLIRLLTGALKPTRGSIRLFGANASDPGFLDARRRTGIVPQSPGMYRDLRCAEYLALVRELYGHGEIDKVVQAFDLRSFIDRPMATLSGGQQRRLSMAAAVLPEPDLLLLDEPTAGLDPVATREVHTWLSTLMKGRTVLLCTHNLAEAEKLCETVVILRAGEVLVHTPIEQLRGRAHTHVVLRASEGAGRVSEAVRTLGHTPEVVEGEVRIAVSDPAVEIPPLLRELLGRGLSIYEARVVAPNLEDLFLDVVGGSHARA